MSWLQTIVNRYRVPVDPLRTERRIELVVLLLFLLLLLQLAYGASRLAILATPESIMPATDSLEVMSSTPLDGVTAKQRMEIRNRPLLWPGRRPVEAVVQLPDPVLEKPTNREIKEIKLRGVFGVGESVGIIVLVKGKPLRIGLGQEVNGWKLESVENNEAVFAAGSQREKIVLQPANAIPDDSDGNSRERRR